MGGTNGQKNERTVSTKKPKEPALPRALPHRLSPSAGSLNIEALHLGFTIPPLPSDRLDRRPSWSRRRGHISQDGGLGSRTHTPSIRMTSIAGLDPFFWTDIRDLGE